MLVFHPDPSFNHRSPWEGPGPTGCPANRGSAQGITLKPSGWKVHAWILVVNTGVAARELGIRGEPCVAAPMKSFRIHTVVVASGLIRATSRPRLRTRFLAVGGHGGLLTLSRAAPSRSEDRLAEG